MARRLFSIGAILLLVMVGVLLLSSRSAYALTPTISRTPSRTSTISISRTPTKTPTGSCALPTSVSMSVAPVTSPSSATTQVIKVTVPAASVTITSEAGTFTSTTPVGGVFNITINLVPNTTNHLSVVASINWKTGCNPYTLTRTSDSSGNPLTIVQGALSATSTRTATLTPTVTSTITKTPTSSTCLATATMVPYLLVEELVGQTTATTYVVKVTLIYGVSVTVTSEAGSFTSTTASPSGVYSVTINLVPNTINHLQVQGKVYRDSCSYDTAVVTVDNFGNPLTIIQGNAGPTLTPTPSISPTPSANACSPVSADIASPFTFDGAGTFCWRATTIVNFINAFNTTSLKVNGVNLGNVYVAASSLPPKIGGYWYISFVSVVPWAHFEAK